MIVTDQKISEMTPKTLLVGRRNRVRSLGLKTVWNA